MEATPDSPQADPANVSTTDAPHPDPTDGRYAETETDLWAGISFHGMIWRQSGKKLVRVAIVPAEKALPLVDLVEVHNLYGKLKLQPGVPGADAFHIDAGISEDDDETEQPSNHDLVERGRERGRDEMRVEMEKKIEALKERHTLEVERLQGRLEIETERLESKLLNAEEREATAKEQARALQHQLDQAWDEQRNQRRRLDRQHQEDTADLRATIERLQDEVLELRASSNGDSDDGLWKPILDAAPELIRDGLTAYARQAGGPIGRAAPNQLTARPGQVARTSEHPDTSDNGRASGEVVGPHDSRPGSAPHAASPPTTGVTGSDVDEPSDAEPGADSPADARPLGPTPMGDGSPDDKAPGDGPPGEADVPSDLMDFPITDHPMQKRKRNRRRVVNGIDVVALKNGIRNELLKIAFACVEGHVTPTYLDAQIQEKDTSLLRNCGEGILTDDYVLLALYLAEYTSDEQTEALADAVEPIAKRFTEAKDRATLRNAPPQAAAKMLIANCEIPDDFDPDHVQKRVTDVLAILKKRL